MLHRGGSFRVSDPIENRVCYASIWHLASDWMSRDHLILVVAPSFPLEERGHCRLIVNCAAVIFDVLKAKVGNEVGKALIEPQVVPPLHGH